MPFSVVVQSSKNKSSEIPVRKTRSDVDFMTGKPLYFQTVRAEAGPDGVRLRES